MQISTFLLLQRLLKAPFLGDIWSLVTSSLCSEKCPLHILIIKFFTFCLRNELRRWKLRWQAFLVWKEGLLLAAKIHCCIFTLKNFFSLRHQLALQSDFCVWLTWSVSYKNSSFKASFALFCGKKFLLTRNCLDTGIIVWGIMNNIYADSQSNFRKCVGLIKVWWIRRKKKLILKEHPLYVRHHSCLRPFSFLNRQGNRSNLPKFICLFDHSFFHQKII